MNGKTNLSQKELKVKIKILLENSLNDFKKYPSDLTYYASYLSTLICLNALGYIGSEEYNDLKAAADELLLPKMLQV